MEQTLTAYEKAHQVLNHPEVYPGLANRNPDDRRFLIWHYPSLEAHKSWALFWEKEDCWVRRIIWDKSLHFPSHNLEPCTYGCEILIPFEKAQQLVNTLSEINLKPFQQPKQFGSDGTIAGIEVGNYWHSCRLSWWDVPSPSWQPLIIWYEQTLSYLESVMPGNTDKMR
jgi:hypothetical protein